MSKPITTSRVRPPFVANPADMPRVHLPWLVVPAAEAESSWVKHVRDRSLLERDKAELAWSIEHDRPILRGLQKTSDEIEAILAALGIFACHQHDVPRAVAELVSRYGQLVLDKRASDKEVEELITEVWKLRADLGYPTPTLPQVLRPAR